MKNEEREVKDQVEGYPNKPSNSETEPYAQRKRGGATKHRERKETSQLTLDLRNTDLFEETISVSRLRVAFAAVKANRGAAGIDGVSVKSFEGNLESELAKLAAEVREWRYRPSPVKRVRLPKPDGGERLLGIPTVRDRVLQYSLKMTVEPKFENNFSESSYGFRPGRNQRQAIMAAKQYVEEGKKWVVDIDLEKFFDCINHDKIIGRLHEKVRDKKILRLVGMTLRSGVLDGGEYLRSEEGTVQGSPLSPLLSNIVLDDLDKELESRGLKFCRYADDCNIFVGSKKAGERVMTSISGFIEKKLKLRVNREKSKVATASEVKFLGVTVKDGMIVIAQKTMKRAMEVVDRLTPRRTHKPLEKQIEEINRWYRGWTSYYQLAECPSQLGLLEAHLRRRLRAQFVEAQKRPRNLFKKYLSLGVSPKSARSAYRRRGSWHKSITHAASFAWPNAWFTRIGLLTRSQEAQPHWKPLTVKVSFS